MIIIPTPEPESEARADSANGRVARILDSQRDEIIREWLGQVLQDPAIPTDSLTPAQVGDHFPHLFDDLTDTLSRHAGEVVAAQSGKHGEDYGAARWQQGFELPEMLRELKHFHSILFDKLGFSDAKDEGPGTMGRPPVSTTLQPFLKRMGIDATEQFLTEGVHERELALVNA